MYQLQESDTHALLAKLAVYGFFFTFVIVIVLLAAVVYTAITMPVVPATLADSFRVALAFFFGQIVGNLRDVALLRGNR